MTVTLRKVNEYTKKSAKNEKIKIKLEKNNRKVWKVPKLCREVK